MFKNFDKVFLFSFKNQAGTKGFKLFTIIFSLVLLLAPPIIMLLVGYNNHKEKTIEGCEAEVVYVVNDTPGDSSFFDTLSENTEEEFSSIRYIICDNMDEAFVQSSEIEKCFILKLNSAEGLVANVIIPDGSVITKKQASNYLKFIDRNSSLFTAALSGVTAEGLMDLSAQTEYKTYTESGYLKGVSLDEDTERADQLMRDQVMKAIKMIIPYVTIMLLYFILLSYGQTLAQSVVMEKESKLMDTMLVSVKPESLVFGKLLASISTVVIQTVLWVASISLGLFLGNTLVNAVYPGTRSYLTVFFSGMKELNVFRPFNVVLAVLFLTLGLVVYLCLAAIAGSMSNTKEEVSSRSSLFIFPLLISFFICIGGGGMSTTTTKPWMLIIPFTGAMLMPANVCLGEVSVGVIIAALICFIVFVVVLIVAAGRIYKMMSLYKGNKIPMSEILKRSFANQK